MANENYSVVLDGYRYTYLSRVIAGGATTLIYEVKGTGESQTALESWVLQLCPLKTDILLNTGIVKCVIQEGEDEPFEAVCEKVMNNGVSGIRFRQAVGASADSAAVRFTIILSAEIDDDCVLLGPEGGSIVRVPNDGDAMIEAVEDSYDCEDCVLLKPFKVFVEIPEGFTIDPDREIEAMVTSEKVRPFYEQNMHIALVLPPNTVMLSNAIVQQVYVVGFVNILVSVPVVNSELEIRMSVCAQESIGVDSQVCCIADGQKITPNVTIPEEFSFEFHEGGEYGNRRMCAVSGNIQIRCIQADV